MSVSGPGLPALLPNETYSCNLTDNEGRYNITVPAIAVTEGVNYTCDITNATFNYMGISSGKNSMYFKITELLTLSAHAREGYSSHFVCQSVSQSVCVSLFYFGEGAVFRVETYISTF